MSFLDRSIRALHRSLSERRHRRLAPDNPAIQRIFNRIAEAELNDRLEKLKHGRTWLKIGLVLIAAGAMLWMTVAHPIASAVLTGVVYLLAGCYLNLLAEEWGGRSMKYIYSDEFERLKRKMVYQEISCRAVCVDCGIVGGRHLDGGGRNR